MGTRWGGAEAGNPNFASFSPDSHPTPELKRSLQHRGLPGGHPFSRAAGFCRLPPPPPPHCSIAAARGQRRGSPGPRPRAGGRCPNAGAGGRGGQGQPGAQRAGSRGRRQTGRSSAAGPRPGRRGRWRGRRSASSSAQAASGGPVPGSCRRDLRYSPQLFLSLRFLAMVVARGRRGAATALAVPSRAQVLAEGCARAGRAPLHSQEAAVALEEGVGRREEKADEPGSASPARVHTNTASHPPCLSPPPGREDSDRRGFATFSIETHTQINSTLHTLKEFNSTIQSQIHKLHYSAWSNTCLLEQSRISTNMLATFIQPKKLK